MRDDDFLKSEFDFDKAIKNPYAKALQNRQEFEITYEKINIWRQKWAPMHHISNWGRNLVDICRRIKWSRQRIIRGYADCDVWNLDWYLAQIIASSVEQLANTANSTPNNTTPEEWSQRLKDASAKIRRYPEGSLLARQDTHGYESFLEGMSLLLRDWPNLWD